MPITAAQKASSVLKFSAARAGERRGVVAVAAVSSAIGFALSAWFKNPYFAMAALTLAFVGLKSTIAPFWAAKVFSYNFWIAARPLISRPL